MKEKPSKPGKSSGKKKQAEPEPVELTPKQLKEKKREEARARAAESRKIVTAGIGQWTGKLPAQLLNEHAQKMKWERVEYPCKSFGREPDQKWVSSVVLARRNPKSKEIERVKFDPPAERVEKQPTQLEARHLAATYGMHRILSHRNMKMMLPPFHRDLWIKLDEDKANAKPHESYKWNEDPWAAEIEHKAWKQKADEDRRQREERREQRQIVSEAQGVDTRSTTNGSGTKRTNDTSSGTSDANSASNGPAPGYNNGEQSLKRIKFNNTLVMSRKARAVVESVIRENNGFQFSTRDALHKSDDPGRYTKIVTMLQKLGFREAYAIEALEYTSSLGAALTWLLIHVPEDDVPQSFMPTDIGATARVMSDMRTETCTMRLRELGYSEEISRDVAHQFEGDLANSVIHLSGAFGAHVEQHVQSSESHNSDAFWREELESLQALLEPDQYSINRKGVCVLRSNKRGIVISFFKSHNYPFEIPGVAVEPMQRGAISKLTQLEITRQTVLMMKTHFAGDYMLVLAFEHIESIFKTIVNRPPKLAQVSSGISGIDESFRMKNAKERINKDKSAPVRKPLVFDSRQVSIERENRMGTSEGKAMLDSRAKLPAWAKRDEIAKLIHDHQVVLITGETGSGKSTQTVQFILDAVPDAQVLCTQPRRISAIGVAQRVAEERLVKIGDQVGYIIRGESKMSKKTQLRFVTAGVLLRMLQGEAQREMREEDMLADLEIQPTRQSNELNGITHVVVDEVHERSLDGDFLLILLKQLVKKAPNIKIILMSATVDPQQFFDYFKPNKVGYTHITGRTFPVKQYHLGDVITATGYRPTITNNRTSGNRSNYGGGSDDDDEPEDPLTGEVSVGKIIGEIRKNSPGRVDYALVGATVEYIHKKLNDSSESGSILVFMSGSGEIDEAIRAINRTECGSSLWTLPLHASLPPAEQRKVFQKAPQRLRKVICSTNVAETSITISDIVAVIDSGRVKETVYDPDVNVSRLVDTWTSQSSATQRMGRAGRVRAGECFKLYSEQTEKERMPFRPLPEILRSPLEVLYLNVKSMGIRDVSKFLSMAIDPPKSTALESARNNLLSYGAINNSDELTSLGKHISMIPSDPKTAKLLVLGTMLGCLPNCLTVAAVLSLSKLPFITKRNDNEFNSTVFNNFSGDNGDLVAACKAYNLWTKNAHDRSQINNTVCRDIRSTRTQLLNSLVSIGLIDPNAVKSSGRIEEYPESLNKYNEDYSTVRAVVSASLQPNMAEIVFPQKKYLSTSGGTIMKEKVDEAKQIKYFKNTGERVFTHPRSLLFGAMDFVDGSRYVSYGAAMMTSKHFIAEITPLSTYALILFSGRVDVDPLGNGIIVDKWTGLKCWPRAGILLQFLQQLLGVLMERKFRDPSSNFIDHPVIKLVHDLIESDGRTQPVGLIA